MGEVYWVAAVPPERRTSALASACCAFEVVSGEPPADIPLVLLASDAERALAAFMIAWPLHPDCAGLTARPEVAGEPLGIEEALAALRILGRRLNALAGARDAVVERNRGTDDA